MSTENFKQEEKEAKAPWWHWLYYHLSGPVLVIGMIVVVLGLAALGFWGFGNLGEKEEVAKSVVVLVDSETDFNVELKFNQINEKTSFFNIEGWQSDSLSIDGKGTVTFHKKGAKAKLPVPKSTKFEKVTLKRDGIKDILYVTVSVTADKKKREYSYYVLADSKRTKGAYLLRNKKNIADNIKDDVSIVSLKANAKKEETTMLATEAKEQNLEVLHEVPVKK